MATVNDIHRELVDAWNRRDWTKYRSLLHPEYRYRGPDGKELVGPDAGLQLAQGYATAFPDGKLELRKVFPCGDTAIGECHATGTHKGSLMGVAATGKRVQLDVCNIVELRDGKVHREREFMDMLTLFIQTGTVKLPGAKPKAA